MRVEIKALSVADAAGSISVGRTKFYDLVARGEIKIVKLGRRTLVPIQEIDAFIKRLQDKANGGVK